MQPFSLASFPRAILHVDADSFFASCEIAKNPQLRGKCVVTGGERGIASSMSYAAKASVTDVIHMAGDLEKWSRNLVGDHNPVGWSSKKSELLY